MRLTILTRTFLQRPASLARNQASVEDQTQPDQVEQLLLVDREQRGIAWTYAHLRDCLPSVRGEYVLLLDDDDYLISNTFVEDLADHVLDSPAVVIVRMDVSGRLMPEPEYWRQPPVGGRIACSCFIVRRDVFAEHVGDFAADYAGDFAFINAVCNCPRGHTFEWWDRVVSRVGQVSHGQAEN
jgi:hypothetical protein